jgi:hypothetical protein
MEEDEVGESCSTYEGEEQYIRGFWWGNLKERNQLEDLGVDGNIILKWVLR